MQPEPDIEQLAPELIGTGAQAVVNNAKRLGLTWTITLATITSADPVEAIADGDTVAIGMVSMIGTLSVGQRVYVIQVPPSGNFIVGAVGPAAGQLMCYIRQTVVQNIANTTLVPITFTGTDVYDPYNMHEPAGTSNQVAIKFAGWYELCGGISMSTGNAVGVRDTIWRVNGSQARTLDGVTQEFNSGTAGVMGSWAARTISVLLGVGDLVDLCAFQNSGLVASTGVGGATGGESCFISLKYLGAG